MSERELKITARFSGAEATKGMKDITQALGHIKAAAVGASEPLRRIPQVDFKKMGRESTQARMGMMNLQYTLRDAPYLFQNLQMGVSAVGENLLMTATSMAAMKKEAGSTKGLIGVLTGALSGPAGLGVALSAALFIIQSVTMIMAKAKRESKELGGSAANAAEGFDILTASVEDMKAAFDKMTVAQIDKEIEKIDKKLEESRRKQQQISSMPMQVGFGGSSAVAAGMAGIFAGKETQKLEEQDKAAESLRKTIGKIAEKERELNAARKALEPLVDETEIAAQNKTIEGIEKELDRLKNLGREKKNQSDQAKRDAEEARRFNEQRQALQNDIAVQAGQKTELDVLAERETLLNAEKLTADKDRQREIELEMLRIAYDRAGIIKAADQKRIEESKQHAENLIKIRDQEQGLAVSELKSTAGADAQTEAQRRLMINQAILNAQKGAIQERLNALQSEIDTSTNLSQLEKDERIMQANELKNELINIEQQITDEKKRAADQAIAEAKREKDEKIRAALTAFNFITGNLQSILSMELQSSQQSIQAEKDKKTAALEKSRDEKLAHAVTQTAKDKINKDYDAKLEKLNQDAKARQAQEQARIFNYQKMLNVAEATENTYTAATAMLKVPVVGAALAAAVVAAGLAYVAKIAGQKAPAYASGGLVRVSIGEYYLDKQTTQRNLPLLQALNSSGKIRGSGSGTSDSIYAVADGGFVVNAAATRQYEPILRRMASGGTIDREYSPISSPVINVNVGLGELKDEFEAMRREISAMRRDRVVAQVTRYETAAIFESGEREIARSRL